MNIDEFLSRLSTLRKRPEWSAFVENDCIMLRHAKCEIRFTPLTAVYYQLSGIEIHHGSFWAEELTREYDLSWHDALTLSHAIFACNCDSVVGRGYDRGLRDKLLRAVGL